jgi:hypothetical protein
MWDELKKKGPLWKILSISSIELNKAVKNNFETSLRSTSPFGLQWVLIHHNKDFSRWPHTHKFKNQCMVLHVLNGIIDLSRSDLKLWSFVSLRDAGVGFYFFRFVDGLLRLRCRCFLGSCATFWFFLHGRRFQLVIRCIFAWVVKGTFVTCCYNVAIGGGDTPSRIGRNCWDHKVL